MHHNAIQSKQLTYGRSPAALHPEDVVRAHSQLVRRVAWQVHSRMSTAIEIEDLIQIGMVALVEAARTFEDRGVAFAPYAAMRVRGAMIDELRRDARMARAGMAKRREIAQVRSRLENQLMRSATDIEMADAMGMSVDSYFAAVASTQAVRQESIDEIYTDHDPLFADPASDADVLMVQAEQRAALAMAIASLSPKEAMVLQLYFTEEMNLDEIGRTLSVGAARVCQIKKAALDKVRARLAGTESD
jgi:RNA polymerase sigma factor FliA